MGKNKRLYRLLKEKEVLKEKLEKEIKIVDFHKNCIVDLFVQLYDLDEAIEEMRGEK